MRIDLDLYQIQNHIPKQLIKQFETGNRNDVSGDYLAIVWFVSQHNL